MAGAGINNNKSNVAAYVGEAVLAGVLFAIGLCIDDLVAPREQFIPNSGLPNSRDADLNYPMYSSTVPTAVLVGICVAVGGPLVFVFSYFGGLQPRKREVYHAVVGYYQAMALCEMLTAIIKKVVGRPRPSFYDQCQWSDVLGQCTGTKSQQWDARQSFVSGHSSMSFVSSVYLTLILMHILRKRLMFRPPPAVPPLLLYLLAALPLGWGAFVSMSRLWDFRHHYSDVLGGALLGMFVAHAVFSVHFKKRPINYSYEEEDNDHHQVESVV